ncbi:hypothetical protein DL764_001591 [Monosporascus ibericus]|uniref:DUF7703 domain-containing protein n=1 Tax=Monosporascus ibericus TaxID=155417 RepID=A0A4Q4TQI7_9PEZI|nr:hypothetical protein DL764_001591 [Monosporascus ibericus]
MSGSEGGYGRDPSIPFHASVIIATFIGIALYNVIELNVIILRTFKHRRGLYFYSFVVATWGIVPWSLGYFIKDFKLVSGTVLYGVFISSGWLYLRLVLAMIIFNAVVLHIPTIVMGFGAQSDNPDIWLVLYPIYEKVEVTIFFLQELVISSLYIICTVPSFRNERFLGKNVGRMWHRLILVNVLVIALDATVLGHEFGNHYDIQTAYKGMVYSIKLKLEFSVLNDLINITKSGQGSRHRGYNQYCSSNLTHSAADAVQMTPYTSTHRETQIESQMENDKDDTFGLGARVSAGKIGPNPTDVSTGIVRVTRETDVTSEELCGHKTNSKANLDNLEGVSASNFAVTVGARTTVSSSSDKPFAHNTFEC